MMHTKPCFSPCLSRSSFSSVYAITGYRGFQATESEKLLTLMLCSSSPGHGGQGGVRKGKPVCVWRVEVCVHAFVGRQ